MGEIISKYFTLDQKRLELLHYAVIKELSFNRKIGIFEEILNHNPEFVKKYPKLKQLDRVRIFRNKIAHVLPNTNEDYVMNRTDDSIQLIVHQRGKEKIEEITVKQMDKELNHASDITEDLVSLMVDMGNPKQDDSKG